MNFHTHKIFSYVSKRVGYKSNPLRNARQASSRSTNQSFMHRVAQQYDSIGGSPVASDALGQPTHVTHPHRLLEGEILPGIQAEEFQARRFKLVENIKSFAAKNDLAKKRHVIIIPSSLKKFMTEAIPYVFRQNSDFLYLTGCLEPDSVLVIISCGRGNMESLLFLRGKDRHSELWDGPRTDTDQAVEFFGVDRSLPLTVFETFITSYTKEHTDCMLWYDYANDIHPKIHKYMKNIVSNGFSKVCESPRPFIHKQRLYKSPAEQVLMKKSCEIGSEAVKAAIKHSKPWDNESHIFARVDFESRINGADYLAYPPVVAGGNRANIIHYVNNNQIIEDGDMVLMDAGCEYRGYTSDITRTWPISGKFTPVQRILYEVVYSIQLDLIDACKKFPSLDILYSSLCKLLGRRMREAGIISNQHDDNELSRVSTIFCPHHVSHYLGMDVHDTSSVPRSIPLEPGMVFTIEPGLYVNHNNKLANPEFRGHGIRIEDDILMTPSGPLVLTSSCPKHPDEIEKLKNTTNEYQ